MGGDGGSIPKRAELVKTSKKKEQADKDMERDAKWSHCAITQRELVKPIVACELGKLYNKESVLEFLLDKSICDSVSHIRSLKDVKELNLTPNTGYDEKCRDFAGHFDTMAAKFICPVSGLEMNGKYRFCLIWSCGCVLSERAMKEVPSEVCHKCGKTFCADDMIVLNGQESDVEKMRESMEARRLKVKLAKKSKKAARLEAAENGFEVLKTENSKKRVMSDHLEGKSKKVKDKNGKSVPKTDKSISEAKDTTQNGTELDTKATKVYKSLFTSGDKHRNRTSNQTSNWVTYNPYHL